jgi:[ribosomal protein S5]-alanine N-acetyltransferase
MIIDGTIETPQLKLVSLARHHASGPYLAWMNDPEIVRYTESRDRKFSSSDLESFIAGCNEDPSVLLLGMIDKRDGLHVGNIKLAFELRHRRGDMGLIVGDKTKWGRGFGRESIAAVTNYAFNALNLAKVAAGCYASNVGSIRAFIAAGWHEEARRKRHALCDGRWEDVILLARFCNGG